MRLPVCILAVLAGCLMISVAAADTVITESGGDTFAAGETVVRTLDVDRDAFAAGKSVTVLGQTQGDLHASGFDVKLDAQVVEDVYAAGATVAIAGPIGKDLTAAAFTLRLEPGARVAENARLMAATINIEAPIAGALAATGRTVYLNAPVAGDARITARTIRFGPDARIEGRLIYATAKEIDVPTRVVPPDRVTFEPVKAGRIWDDIDQMREMPILPTFASMLFGFLITLFFFVLLGAIALAFFPNRLEAMRVSITDSFGQTALLGIVGLSLLFGALPVTALTIVGLPFLPVLLLCIVAGWTLSYALGAYAVATRVWFGLGGDADPGMLLRLLILAMAIVAIALLNFIPFVGWLANYTLVLLGMGAITRIVFAALLPDADPALDVEMKET